MVAIFGSQFSLILSIAMMITIGVATLHGGIVNLRVDSSMVTGDFKQQVIEASPFAETPIALNADLAEIMKEYTPGTPHIWDGFRLVHFNGEFMDDSETIAEQLPDMAEDDDEFLFKLVFMKQQFMADIDHNMVIKFQTRRCTSIVVFGGTTGTQFIVEPVWGPGEAGIVGIFYQHHAAFKHCAIAGYGGDPRQVSSEHPVFAFDFGPTGQVHQVLPHA